MSVQWVSMKLCSSALFLVCGHNSLLWDHASGIFCTIRRGLILLRVCNDSTPRNGTERTRIAKKFVYPSRLFLQIHNTVIFLCNILLYLFIGHSFYLLQHLYTIPSISIALWNKTMCIYIIRDVYCITILKKWTPTL